MALTEVYVDPSIAADSGTGTIGDPFGDLEYAIRQTTFDTVNGTRVNVKAGTAEVLASTLTAAMANVVTTPAWATGVAAPAVFQGYTSVAGDGGLASIDINGANTVTTGADAYLVFRDIHFFNSSSAADIFSVGSYCTWDGCIFSGMTGGTIVIDLTAWGYVGNCYFYDVNATRCIRGAGVFEHNYIDGVGYSNNPSYLAIETLTGSSPVVRHNIMRVTGACGGFNLVQRGAAYNNSVYSDGGTGTGILYSNAAPTMKLSNNLVEGFSGVGGVGIALTAASFVQEYSGNAVYNCTTPYNESSLLIVNLGDNEVLTASPFNDAANGDFSPVNVGNVIEGALPQVIGGGLV